MNKILLTRIALMAAATALILPAASHAEDAAVEASAKEEAPALSEGMAALLPAKLMDAQGKEISSDQLIGKTVGFYFSAHWCPPCRSFTPMLVKFRDANKDEFEVVFISSDRSPKDQLKYMTEAKMGWPAIKHGDAKVKELKTKYGVSGIPTLVIVAPDGKTITKSGRRDVSSSPDKALAKWTKKDS